MKHIYQDLRKMKFKDLKNIIKEETLDPFIIQNTDMDKEVFAVEPLEAGQIIGIYSIISDGEDQKTPLGDYISRSQNPNAELRKKEEQIILIAKEPIQSGEIITTDWEPEEIDQINPIPLDLSEESWSRIKNELKSGISTLEIEPENLKENVIYLTPWGEKVRVLFTDYGTQLQGYIIPTFSDGSEVDNWREEMGIELINPELSIEEIEKRWLNWQLMNNEMQKISDQKSQQLFGKTNADIVEDRKKDLLESKCRYLSYFYGIPITESSTYYDLRNFIYLLIRKVRKQQTKDVLTDIMNALKTLELKNIPLFGIQKLTVPSRKLP